MSEGVVDTETAPTLGEPTDVQPSADDVTSAAGIDEEAGAAPAEQTMQTPDELGGTGGEQAGGAG